RYQQQLGLDGELLRDRRRRLVARRIVREGLLPERVDAAEMGFGIRFDPDRRGLRAFGHSNSRMMASTARLSPGLAFVLLTVPAFSARRMFSIFIASTTASGWPASTLSPSPTWSAVSSPGIGQIRYFDRSGGTFSLLRPLRIATS